MRTPLALKVALLGASLTAAPAAHALEMEFYTWNAFEETVAGFQRVALVLQDPGFLVFALVFAVLGTLVGLLTAAAKGVMGQQINPVSVLIPAVIGIAIFRGLVIPTGTIHIYDPVRNAYQPVGDVPDAVILIAGVLNKIERGVVEIVETASADPAAERSGSLRYSLVLNALTSKRQDTYFERNSSIYFTECGMPSMGMGYNGASLDSLLRRSTDLIDEWQKWRHPSIFATVYSGTGDQKVTMSCRDVWDTVLKPTATNAAQFAELVDSVCRKVGFDPSVGAQATRCEEELTSLQALYGVTATSSLSFVRSIVFAASVTDAMRDADISVQQGALVNRQVMAEGFGAAEAMDRWVPKLRGFMTATVLGLIPLVCLFLLTPVMGKALSLVVGLFLWLALWGIADAISVQMAADAAADAFDEIGRFGLSYDSLMLSPEAAIQSLGVFGKARTMALMLATVLSYGLFSFGGYAFTSMAQAWQSDLQQAGENAGRTVLSPEERGALLSRLAATPGGEAAIAAGGFQNAAYSNAAGGLRAVGGTMSDRHYVTGALQGNATPGGAGGTDTTPASIAPGATTPAAGAASDRAAPFSRQHNYVNDRLSGPQPPNTTTPGGAGGTDTTPSATRPDDQTLPDVTVTARGYRPDDLSPRATSVGDLDRMRGEQHAGSTQGELGAWAGLAESRGVPIDTASRDVTGTRTAREIHRTDSWRERLNEDRTSASEAGRFEGATDFGRLDAERRVYENVNGTDALDATGAAEYGALTNAGAIGQSEVVTPERLADNYATQTTIQTESARAIETRHAAPLVGEMQGVRQVVDARAVDRTRHAFGATEAGERAMTEGQTASMTSNASFGRTLATTPGGTTQAARELGENDAAGALAERRVVDAVRSTLDAPDTPAGLIDAQEALRGSRSLVLDPAQTKSLIERSPQLDLSPEQRALIDGDAIRAQVGISHGSVVTADLNSGTSASHTETAREDHSFGIQGGLMALDQLDRGLMAVTRGDPMHGTIDPRAKWTLARTIASAIEATGTSVSASRSESGTFSVGVQASASARAGVASPRGPSFGGGIEGQGGYLGQSAKSSATRIEGTVLEGERILHEARESVLADFESRTSKPGATTLSNEDFVRAWRDEIKRMTLESAARFRKDGESAWTSHDPVREGEDARSHEHEPPKPTASARELAYRGGID